MEIINLANICRQVEIAADNGNIDAMVYYGAFLKKGYGKNVNNEESYIYFKLAADKGKTDGMIQCALLLSIKNDPKGIDFLKKQRIMVI